MTSREYRENKELEDLNEKVNTNWQQISNMEALIQKKTQLLAARQAQSLPPAAPSTSHAPSAPVDDPDSIARVDVHVPPVRSTSATTLQKQVVNKK